MDGAKPDAGATMPLVSVLVPAYNHEAYVQRCLDSVLEEPYPAKEIVIIDDGSTDATGQRIAEWIALHGDEVPVEYVQRGNKGIVATLNELAARARGDFLRLGASDDYLLPGGLQAQVDYLMTHPGKWAVIGDTEVVDRQGYRLHESGMRDLHHADKALYYTDDGIRRAVITQWAIGGPVTLVRRRALETVAGWTEGLRFDDWDFFLRLAAHDAIGFIDRNVCAYRIHGANVSRTRDARARIHNLVEARDVAIRRLCMFDEPYRTLLLAQSHYLDAKVAFLQRRLWPVAMHMAAYGALRLVARLRRGQAHRLATQA